VRVAPVRPPAYDFGVAPSLANRAERVQADSLPHALALGSSMSVDLIKQLYVTLKRLATGDVSAKNLGGIIRISQVSYRAAERGPTWLLYLLAMLSLNLAVVNLLPVPILDGGHLAFLAIEAAKGSPVNPRVLGYSQMAGLVFILFLVLFVTYNDILQLL
jgi:regulator of sigma E protease